MSDTLENSLKPFYRSLAVTLLLAATVFAQVDTVTPGDNLVSAGIPPIQAAIAREVGRYTEFRSAALSSWNPARREMLITTRFGDVPQIHYVKFPGGARTQLTFFADRVAGASFGPKRDDYFLFSKDVGGGEWFQLYRYDRASGTITLLTDGKSRNILGPWSNAGDKLAYTSTRRNGKDLDLYVMNPKDPTSDRMLAQVEGGGWLPIDWSPDDRAILVLEGISANESYLWLFDASTGTRKLLTPKGGTEQVCYTNAKLSKDGKGIYVTTDKNSEFQRLAYLDFSTNDYKFLTDYIAWDIDEFDLSRDGTKLAFIANENGVGILHLLNTATGKELPVPRLPMGIISGVQWHNDNKYLGFNLVSARSTSDVYSLDVSTGNVDRWTFSETGGLNIDNFSEPELITWKTFDGKTISGFLYRPPEQFTGKRPVVVNIHGGPEGQFRPGFLGRNNYLLNELGVAIIFPNIRGSSGYGKTFLKIDNGFLREDAYKDIGFLLDWIKAQPTLDGNRIMVTGGSYGGHMTLATATYYNDKIACSVDIVGPSNLVTFLEHTEGYRRDLRRVEYGDERDPKMRAFLEQIAPLNNAGKITKPMFVIQGRNDPRVPYTEAEQMVAILKNNQTPVWYLLAKDEGHGFAKKKNQDYQFYATVMFIREFLLK